MPKPRDCKIIELRATTTKADGTPMMTTRGQQIWKVDLKIEERPEIWISGVVYSDPSEWTGKTKSLILYAEDHQGVPLPKFKLAPPKSGVMLTNEKLDDILDMLRQIRDLLQRD